MIDTTQACDPTLHHLATRLAERCLQVVQRILPRGSEASALEAFYLAAREELSKPPRQEEL